ncbi:MAG: ABC transporter substrate-binding protein [Anaerolineaceae bacterium]|nr:ABC transporter substrate-binding protein [Anaerolineaceae bacterium]
MNNNNKPYINKLLFIVLSIGLLSSLVSGCTLIPTESPGSLTPITLNLTYIPNIQFAPIYVAIQNGYFAEYGLDVSLNYGNEADMIALVGSGNQSFMIASGEQVLLSRAQGVPVVYVAAWYQDYPVGVVSFSDKDIRVPDSMAGRDIGIPGLFGASYIGFEALRSSANLSEKDVRLIPIGFNQVESLVSEQVEAAVIYIANEPVVLKSLGYDVSVIRVTDYLELVGNGIVTNEDTIKKDPDLVRQITSAFLKGVRFCQDSPDEAFEISKSFVENLSSSDGVVQKEILAESIKLWQTEEPGYSAASGWINMQQLLLNIGMMTSPINLDEAFTNDFIK